MWLYSDAVLRVCMGQRWESAGVFYAAVAKAVRSGWAQPVRCDTNYLTLLCSRFSSPGFYYGRGLWPISVTSLHRLVYIPSGTTEIPVHSKVVPFRFGTKGHVFSEKENQEKALVITPATKQAAAFTCLALTAIFGGTQVAPETSSLFANSMGTANNCVTVVRPLTVQLYAYCSSASTAHFTLYQIPNTVPAGFCDHPPSEGLRSLKPARV